MKFEMIRDGSNRKLDVFCKKKAEISCCTFVKPEIEREDGALYTPQIWTIFPQQMYIMIFCSKELLS